LSDFTSGEVPVMTAKATSDDALREQAYCVSRGVRALALAGSCKADPEEMLAVQTRLEALGEPGAIPFVCPRNDEFADCGYAAAAWVIDLYRWLVTVADEVVMPKHRHRIVGLLLGYGVSAIGDYEEQAAGRACHQPAMNSGSA
jgi:hypothetical protein